MATHQSEPDGPSFDDALAASYVGKYILVGLTYCDHTGAVVRRQQLHGRIESATRIGILIVLEGAYAGQSWNMPPDLEVIAPAPPGEYRLATTGETVANPDLLATWQITAPPPDPHE